MIDCRESARLMSQRRDRRLSLRKRFELWRHLVACVLCRAYDKQVAVVCRISHHAGAKPCPHSPGLSDERKRAIHNALEREQA